MLTVRAIHETPVSLQNDRSVERSELARYPRSKGAAMVDAVALAAAEWLRQLLLRTNSGNSIHCL
jgi:hypothetical protein